MRLGTRIVWLSARSKSEICNGKPGRQIFTPNCWLPKILSWAEPISTLPPGGNWIDNYFSILSIKSLLKVITKKIQSG